MGVPRIARAEVIPLLVGDPPLLNAIGVHQPWTPRLIVELETDEGAVGFGETYGDSNYLAAARALAEQVAGAPLYSLNTLMRRADRAGDGRADGGDTGGLRGALTGDKLRRSVVSAFEVASLDALGRITGLPVHALLGGKVRDRVEYSAYLFYRWAQHPEQSGPSLVDDWGAALDADGVVAQARRFADVHGFRSFKLKGGVFAPEEEMAAINALAEEFPGAPLRLDPNGGWSIDTSVRVARELDGVLEYLEDPTLGVAGMAEVHRRTGMPLATNMCVTSFEEVPAAFAARAAQIVLADHHYWGGLQATRELAAVARTFGFALSMHSTTHLGISLAAMTHGAAVVPELAYACDTHRPWQSEDVVVRPPQFIEGALQVSDAPGLGVDIDRDALAALHERWLELGVRERDDVAAMRVADPEWRQPVLPRF
jgi:glucarate dehydratase